MKRKFLLSVITLISCAMLLMGLKTANQVLAHRALELGENTRALQLYLTDDDFSGAGMTYCAMKQFDQAINTFKKVKDDSGVGMAYCGKRKFDEAIPYFEQKKDNSGLGLVYSGKRDYAKAEEYFTKANDRAGLGLVALGRKDYAQARQWFKSAQDNNGLGLVLLAEKEFDSAFKHFKNYKNKSGMGMALLGKKEYNQAISYFAQAKDFSGLSLAYSGKREYDKAISFASQANDLSALGHAYCGKKEYDKAIEYFTEANDLSGLSFAYSGKQEYDKAIDYAKQANDDSALAYAHCGKRAYDKAIEYAKKANDKSALGHAYCGKKEYDKALDYFKQANDNSGIGLIYCGKRDFDAAMQYAQAANDDKVKGLVYCGKKEYDIAIEYFEKANDSSGLSLAYSGKKDFIRAVDYAQKANDLSALANAYCGKREFDAAIKYFEQANDLSGLSYAYSGKRDFKKAIEYAQKANDKSALGLAYCGKKEYDTAINYFTQANDDSGIALVYCGKRDYVKAISYAQKANDKSALGHAYCGKRDYDKAIEYFEQAKDDSGLSFAYCGKKEYNTALNFAFSANDLSAVGHAYCGSRNFDAAISSFIQVNDFSGLSYTYSQKNQFDIAIEYARKANDLSALGHAYCGNKEYDKALDYFKQANDNSGLSYAYCGKNMATLALDYAKDANDNSAVGFAYLKRHEYEKAKEAFSLANDKSGLGHAYARQGEYTKALEFANEANDVSLKGYVYLNTGRIKEAEACFAQEKDLSGLGHTFFKKSEYDKALDYFSQANDLSGQGGVHSKKSEYKKAKECFEKANDISGLGKLAFKMTDYKQAVEYFEKANDYDGLGEVYYRLRNFEKAAEMFKKEGNHVKVVYVLSKKYDTGLDEAVRYAYSIIDEGRLEEQLYLELGKIYHEHREYAKAIEVLNKILYKGSYYEREALVYIAKAYFFEKKYDLAESTLKQLIAQYPDTEFLDSAQKTINMIDFLEKSSEDQESLTLNSNNSCGPEALKQLLAFSGINSSVEELASLANTEKDGTTMLGLKEAAKNKGIDLQAVMLNKEQLSFYPKKAIMLIDGKHYVLLKESRSDGIVILDGSSAKEISYADLSHRWKGAVLVSGEVLFGRRIAMNMLDDLKGGDRRSSEGDTTKNDPGVLPNGSWDVEYGVMGGNLPIDFLTMTNTTNYGTGRNPKDKDPDNDAQPYSGSQGPMPPSAGGVAVPVSGVSSTNSGGITCNKKNDPISITGGQLIIPIQDINIATRGRTHGLNLELTRTYSSRSNKFGLLGYNWYVSFDVRLQEVDTQSVVLNFPDGIEFSYINDGSGVYRGPACDGSFIIKDANGYYVWHQWTTLYGWQYYHFDGLDKLAYIEDQFSNRITYTYEAGNIIELSDDSGRSLKISYKQGKIDKVTCPLNIEYFYYYDLRDNLINVTGPNGYDVQYEYNDQNDVHNLTASVDSNNNRTEYAYDADDSCIYYKDPLNNEAAYSFDYNLGWTFATDTRGKTAMYVFGGGNIFTVADPNRKYIDYTYDSHFQRNGIIDINQNRITWVNDEFGNCLSIKDAQNRTTNLTYNAQYHRVEQMTDYRGRQWKYVYDEKGNVIERITPSSEIDVDAHTTYIYDSYGNLTKINDPEGKSISYSYDANGNITKVANSEGDYIDYTYDNLDRITSEKYDTDPQTTYTYNGLTLQKITFPDGSYAEYEYDNNGNITSFRDANGRITTYVYNGLDQCVSENDVEGNTVRYEYDSFGNVIKIIRDISGRDIVFQKEFNDFYNRLTKIIDEVGEVTAISYEKSPPITGSSDYTKLTKYKKVGTSLIPVALDTRSYDARYRLTSMKDGLNKTVQFQYDDIGNLISVNDQNNHVAVYEYASNCNLKLKDIDPLQKEVNYTYYKNGSLKTKADAKGQTIQYQYDLAGRLSRKTYPDGTFVAYQYNKYGKISQLTDSTGITSYLYDNRQRITQIDGPKANDTVSYTYDFVGNVLTMSVAGEGVTQYSYYNNNLLDTIIDPQGKITTFTYDTAYRCVSMDYANGMITELDYYDNDRIKEVRLKNPSSQLIAKYAYEYNTLGQISKITDIDNNYYTYSYDNVGRLLVEEARKSSGSSIYRYAYQYDAAGNRTAESGTVMTYNGANLLLSRYNVNKGINITYQYDNNGNLISENNAASGSTTYSYDFENRLVSVQNAFNLAQFTYNGIWQRKSVSLNGNLEEYIYDDMLPVVKRNSAGNTLAVYTRIPGSAGGIGGLVSRWNGVATHYYHNLMLDNVTQISDDSDNIVQEYDYSAFGNVVNKNGSLSNELQFQDKESLEDFGLVFYGARYYKPSVGRFITSDPMGMIDGPNMYLFCGNDPVNSRDPYGLAVTWPGFGGVGDGLDDGIKGIPDSGANWGDMNGRQGSTQPGAGQINGCGNSSEVGGKVFSRRKGDKEEIKTRKRPGPNGETIRIRKIKDLWGKTKEVWHEVFDKDGNVIHRDWKGPGSNPYIK